LFATISGAHDYGFPSPVSDFDLRGADVRSREKVIVYGQKNQPRSDGGLRHKDF
jgi:predicted nucleotidyltransferase